jgi:predicted metalloprotease with PDZ domain
MAAPARYLVTPLPHEHLFEVEARLPVPAAGPLDLWMPVWTPGSYLVREFPRHLQQLGVHGERGQPLAVERIDKST